MKSAWAAIAAALISPAVSANPALGTKAFQGFSESERATLDQGRAFIRQASAARSLSPAALGDFADEIRNCVRSLDANYIGEVIMVVPAGAASPGFLQALAKDFANVEGYVGIPYWSKQNNRTYDLFDKMKIVERTTQTAGQTVVADQHMEPFDEYKSFSAVSPGNMVWYLYGFPQDGAMCLYGVGAVKTFDLFGLLGDRLKTSFMGRIQAFFSYHYGKRAGGTGKNG